MTSHNDAVKAVLLALSEAGALAAKRDVGLFYDRRGNPRRIGIPGEADVQGTMPGGRAVAVEVKTGNARRTDDQIRWAAAFEQRGGLYFVLRVPAGGDARALMADALAAKAAA